MICFYSILVRLKVSLVHHARQYQMSFYSILVRLKVEDPLKITQQVVDGFYSILVRLKGN